MFCQATFGMLMVTASLANFPCSDFDPVKPPMQVVRLDPIPEQQKTIRTTTVPDPRRTAIYDISARAVILPSGEKLEAHSGLGSKLDNPSYTKIKGQGPTPPNHYKLSLRERLFHGVKAIRLNPVYEDKMFGRDGILAHPYMLGPRGDSYGCVSLKNYDRFLKEYLSGKVTDIVVVKTSNDIKQYAMGD